MSEELNQGGQAEPLNFYLDSDIVVKLGGKKEVKIPRLKFKNTAKVLGIISKIMSEDFAAAIKTAGAGANATLTMDRKAYNTHADLIIEVLPKLIKSKNYDVVEQVLLAISEGALKSNDIEEMQLEEAVNLTAHLVNVNFASLKNLTASLAAISTSTQK